MLVHVPTVLHNTIKAKSIAEKVLILDSIQNHPIHPYIIDMITQTLHIGMSNGATTEEIIDHINICLELFNEKFDQKKSEVLV